MAAGRQRNSFWLVLVSQVMLVGFSGVCVAISPSLLFEKNEGGVSNYGVRPETVVPYTLALSLSALLLWLAGRALPMDGGSSRGVKLGLEATAVFFALVLFTTYPYKVDHPLNLLHVVIAALLFVVQLILLTWMAFVSYRSWRNVVLWLFWFIGFAIGGATLAGLLHLLLVAQAIMMVGFAALTVAVVRGLVCETSPGAHPEDPHPNGR